MAPEPLAMDDSGRFTGAQVLESAWRAEAAGNRDHALYFYAYVAQNFPGSSDAAQALAGLQRLEERPGHRTWPQAPQAATLLNGASAMAAAHRPGTSSVPAMMVPVRQLTDPYMPHDAHGDGPPAHDRSSGARRHRRRRSASIAHTHAAVPRYRVGRFLSKLASIVGGAGVVFGCGALAAGALLPASRTANTVASLVFSSPWAAAGFSGAAVLVLLIGQIGKAVFATARAVAAQAVALGQDDDTEE